MDSSTTTTCSEAAAGGFFSSQMTTIVMFVLAFPTLFWLVAYLVPKIYIGFVRPVPDLKARYGAKWGLVSGGGSGIGRGIANTLAAQGLNVVVVSLDDEHLANTIKELRAAYPDQQFRAVGVNFARDSDYMAAIKKAVADIEVQIVFNNAGFLVTGFFDSAPLGKLLTNIECNAVAAVQISHYFLQRWIPHGTKGCIVFTSSVAGFIPTPFAVMYAATKAFVSQFAASLHIECQPLGIDVCAIHPSPVKSNFYTGLDHKVDMIEAAAKNAVTPESITDDIFRSIGVCAIRDLGALAWGTRMGTFFLPYNFFAELFALAAPVMPDWKTHNVHRVPQGSSNKDAAAVKTNKKKQ